MDIFLLMSHNILSCGMSARLRIPGDWQTEKCNRHIRRSSTPPPLSVIVRRWWCVWRPFPGRRWLTEVSTSTRFRRVSSGWTSTAEGTAAWSPTRPAGSSAGRSVSNQVSPGHQQDCPGQSKWSAGRSSSVQVIIRTVHVSPGHQQVSQDDRQDGSAQSRSSAGRSSLLAGRSSLLQVISRSVQVSPGHTQNSPDHSRSPEQLSKKTLK